MILPALILALMVQAAEDGPQPIERQEPMYPAVGAQFGIQANCRARFDVTPQGRAENICVACGTTAPADLPSSAADYVAQQFINASRDAMAAWRYTAAPETRVGVETQFVFRLMEDDGTPMEGDVDTPSLDTCDSNRISYLSTQTPQAQGLN
ncbi:MULTISPECIES: hypothetical protein [Hyphobacterium]|uniref:TonB C-terminal domain-containing protein n=1 Tax=Hyphobacterium vulgare TaxID=1736751 RepID=A0ABV6ZXR4_9PROT